MHVCTSASSSLPQSLCEMRGCCEVTEGRCSLPSFEVACKDGGRRNIDGNACYPMEAFYRLYPGKSIRNALFQLTSHSGRAAVDFVSSAIKVPFCNTFG